jgi:hypothetical protein
VENKKLKISIGIILSVGLIIILFFVLNNNHEKDKELDETLVSDIKDNNKLEDLNIEDKEKLKEEIKEDVEDVTVVKPDIKDEELVQLPNLENEVSKWNIVFKELMVNDNQYLMTADKVEKIDSKSTKTTSLFVHVFDSKLPVQLHYYVDNTSKEITEMRIVGHELAGADRNGIFHFMSGFVSYVDSEVSIDEAAEHISVTFSTDVEGMRKTKINDKNYEYVLDFSDGLNMLVYKK